MTQQIYVLYCVSCKKEIVETGYQFSRETMFDHIALIHIRPYLDENTDRRFTDFIVWSNYWGNFVEGRKKKC